MNTNQIAKVAALIGEPARTAMLMALMDGRALTASELARAGNILPQTASRHLALMIEGGLVSVTQQGRHRYHKLQSADVAKILENIMQISTLATPTIHTGPRAQDMRQARLCYDHLAGRLGVAITRHLCNSGAIILNDDSARIDARQARLLEAWGIPDSALSTPAAHPACRPCLDWSERKPHLAGPLGKLICSHCLEQGWLTRKPDSRALSITGKGAQVFSQLLGMESWDSVRTYAK